VRGRYASAECIECPDASALEASEKSVAMRASGSRLGKIARAQHRWKPVDFRLLRNKKHEGRSEGVLAEFLRSLSNIDVVIGKHRQARLR
jgi:hypothetical protein